jgi:hypothetical protein
MALARVTPPRSQVQGTLSAKCYSSKIWRKKRSVATKNLTPRNQSILVGRPLKFKTVAELELAIQTYFDECDPHIIKHMEATGFNERGETMWRERSIMSEQRPYTRREPAVRSVRERCQVQPDQ